MTSQQDQPGSAPAGTPLESAMATGSEDGSPGEHESQPELTEDERVLLQRLTEAAASGRQPEPADGDVPAEPRVAPASQPAPVDAGPDDATPLFREPPA